MSLLGGALGGLLLEKAGQAAGPLVKKILAGEVGNGQLLETLLESLAGDAGVPRDSLPELSDDALADAMQRAEAASADMLAQWVASQQLMQADLAGERDKAGHWFGWAWRPGWMWLLGFLWTWALLLRPLVNAAFGASIEALDMSVLTMLTTVYVGLYMGGHTVKEVVKR